MCRSKLFAATPDADDRAAMNAGRVLTFNVAQGRCELARAKSFVSVELLLLPSVVRRRGPTLPWRRYNRGPNAEVAVERVATSPRVCR